MAKPIKTILAVVTIVILITSGTVYAWHHQTAVEKVPTRLIDYYVYFYKDVYDIQFTINNSQYESLVNSNTPNPDTTYLEFYVNSRYSDSAFPVYNAAVYNGNHDPVGEPLSQQIILSILLSIFLKENPSLIMNISTFESSYKAIYKGYESILWQETEDLGITLLNSVSTIASSIDDIIEIIRGYVSGNDQAELKNMALLISDILEGAPGLTQHFSQNNISRTDSVLVTSGLVSSDYFSSADAIRGLFSLPRSSYPQFLTDLYMANYETPPTDGVLTISSSFLSNLVNDISSMGLQSFLSVFEYLLDNPSLYIALETTGWELLGGFFEFSIPLALAAAISSFIGLKFRPVADYLSLEEKIEQEIFKTLMNEINKEEAHTSVYIGFLHYSHISNVSDVIDLVYNYSLMLGMTELWYKVNSQYLQYSDPNSGQIPTDNFTIVNLQFTQDNLEQIVENANQAAASINLAN